MIVILGNALLLALYSVIFRNSHKVLAVLGGVQIFLLLALRGEFYGADALYYSNGYALISMMSWDEVISLLSPNPFDTAGLVYPYSFENGWVLLNWVFSALGFGYRGLMVFLSAVTAISFALFCYRFSKDPGYSLYILSCLSFLLYSFFILRQTLALAVCLFAVFFVVRRRPLPFALLILLAFSFHRSSVVFFALYPLYGLRATRKTYLFGLGLFAVLLVLSMTVLPRLVELVFQAMGKSHWISEIGFSWNNLIALQLLIVVCCLFFDLEKISTDKLDNLCLIAMLGSLLIYAVMLNNEQLARANEYYWIFVTLLIPALLQRLEPRMRTLGRMAVGLFLLGFLIYQVQGSTLDPYVSIFGVIGGA